MNNKKQFNVVVALALIAYPIFVIICGLFYYKYFGLGTLEISLFIFGYYAANISVGIGLHRLWSHASYKTHKWVEFILLMLSSGTLQGPVLAWASDHRNHHAYTDTDKDPHSPQKFGGGIKGFLWSHIGWMLFDEGTYKHLDKMTMHRLGKNKLLIWQLRHYWKIVIFMNFILPPLFGFIIDGTIKGIFAGYVFIGLARAVQQHMTFCVNSLCHYLGSRKYTTNTSGDIWWMSLLLLGENYHNFHHAFASDYRNGHRWYHMDAHKWIIYLMSKCGLAWDLIVTHKARIISKMQDVDSKITTKLENHLLSMEDRLSKLVTIATNKIQDLNKSAASVISHNVEKVLRFQEMSELLIHKINTIKKQMQILNRSSENLIKKAEIELQKLEKFGVNIGIIPRSF